MPMVTNTSTRVLHIGGVMLVPGQATEVPDDVLSSDAIKEHLEAKTIVPSEEAEKLAAEQAAATTPGGAATTSGATAANTVTGGASTVTGGASTVTGAATTAGATTTAPTTSGGATTQSGATKA